MRKLISILAGISVVGLLIAGCSDPVTPSFVVDVPVGIVTDSDDTVFPFSQEYAPTGVVYEGTLYMAGSDYASECIGAALTSDRTWWHISQLKADGYSLEPSLCKHIETSTVIADTETCGLWNPGDTIPLAVTVLVFSRPADPGDALFGVVRVNVFDDKLWITQTEEVFYGDDPGAYWPDPDGYVEEVGFEILPDGSYGRLVWMQSFPPSRWLSVNVATRSPLFDPGAWNWKSWLKCAAAATAGSCATASIVCIFATVAYPACLGVGCGGGAVGSMVGCAVAQLL